MSFASTISCSNNNAVFHVSECTFETVEKEKNERKMSPFHVLINCLIKHVTTTRLHFHK